MRSSARAGRAGRAPQDAAVSATAARSSWSRRRALLVATPVVAAAVLVAVVVLSRLPPPADAEFGSRPTSEPIECVDRDSVTISGHTFRDVDDAQPAISIRNCDRVVIEYNDFIDVAEPIYVYGSRDVTIRGNRYRNITGPHERDGTHRGNFVQLDHVTGGRIADNIGRGGDTEDVISVYHSGGSDAGDPLVIEGNRFQGTNWTSTSGSGILLGDGGGSYVVVRRNVLVDIGQVGIGVAGGTGIRVLDNIVYGSRRTGSNVGIYVWGQGVGCSAIEVSGNRVDFTKADRTPAPFYDAGNCGVIEGVADNRFGSALDPARLRVRL